MLKVGLAGVGGISGAHIPAWEAMEDAELVALCATTFKIHKKITSFYVRRTKRA